MTDSFASEAPPGPVTFAAALRSRRVLAAVDDGEVFRAQVERGWTAGDVVELTAWAEVAAERGALDMSGPDMVGRLLIVWHAAEREHQAHIPEVGLLPWLMLACGAPGRDEFYAVRRLLLPGHLTARSRSGRVAKADAAPWLALGECGPLAYAAGLPAKEAVHRFEAGMPEVGGLKTLAGLRGWVFSPR